MTYLQLFWSFFQIGLFSFGGGYAAMPLIQSQVVDAHGWLTMTTFTNLITISQMTPGPISINAASFVGTQIAGLSGAIVATVGCVLPSCLIVSLLSYLYRTFKQLTAMQGALECLRPTVVALIQSAGLSMLVNALFPQGFSWNLSALDVVAALQFVAAFALMRRFRLSPMLIMVGCGIVGGTCYLVL